MAKLNEAYVPKVLAAHLEAGRGGSAAGIVASSPKGSSLVLLKSKSSETETAPHLDLHKEVLALLLADHGALISGRRKSLELQLAQARGAYESLGKEGLVLEGQLKRLEASRAPLEKEIARLLEHLSSAVARLEGSMAGSADQNNSLAVAMFGGELERSRNALASLEQRLEVGLPLQRAELEVRLGSLERQKAAKGEEIAAMQDILRSVRQTRAVAEPARSLGPVGPGPYVTIGVLAFAGLLLGVFAAFFAEFLQRAREASSARASKARP